MTQLWHQKQIIIILILHNIKMLIVICIGDLHNNSNNRINMNITNDQEKLMINFIITGRLRIQKVEMHSRHISNIISKTIIIRNKRNKREELRKVEWMMVCRILLKESMSNSNKLSRNNSQEGEVIHRILISLRKFRGTINIICGIDMIWSLRRCIMLRCKKSIGKSWEDKKNSSNGKNKRMRCLWEKLTSRCSRWKIKLLMLVKL